METKQEWKVDADPKEQNKVEASWTVEFLLFTVSSLSHCQPILAHQTVFPRRSHVFSTLRECWGV